MRRRKQNDAHILGQAGPRKELPENDQHARLRVAEGVLMKLLDELLALADHDFEKSDAHTLALIQSIGTIVKVSRAAASKQVKSLSNFRRSDCSQHKTELAAL